MRLIFIHRTREFCAINSTTVELTFAADAEVTAEDLAAEVLKITDSKSVVIEAAYRDGSLAEGKAFFDLPLNVKLVDAETYTAELGGSKVEFVAKVLAPYAKKFNVTTTALTATGDTAAKKSIFFDAVDQFGDAIGLAATTNLKVAVSYNNLPLSQGATDEFDIKMTDGKLEVVINEAKRALAKDAKVEVKVETLNADLEVIETSTASFTVVKGEAAVATTIDPIKATYKATVGDTQKVGDKAIEVLPNNQITLTTEVKDQHGNPVAVTSANLVRWVVKDGKDLIAASDSDLTSGSLDTPGKSVSFKAVKPGTVTIEAFNIANGVSQTYTVEIAASKLSAITVDVTDTVKDADGANLVNSTPYNKEAAIVAVLTADPTSALLTAENVKFEVKTSTKDVTKADLVVKAEKITVGKGATAKDHIVVKATSDKTATFTATPYIGESFEKATIKGNAITVKSIANPTVDVIEVEAVKANELQVAQELVKAIKFFNKHGEKISVQATSLKTVGTAGLAPVALYKADADGKKVDGAVTGAEEVAFIGVTATAKGNHTLNLIAGPKSVSVALTAVEAGKIQSVTLGGGSTVSVIMADKYDAKDETDNIVVDTNKAYTLIPVSAKDTYGVDVTLKSTDLDLTTKPTNVSVEYFSDLKGTKTTTDVKYVGVHAATGAETGTFTVKLSGDVTAVEGFVAPSKQITVLAERKADKVTVTPATLNLGLGGTTTIKVNVIDQYKKAFNLSAASDVTVTAPKFAIADKKQSVDAKSVAIVGQYEFKATANDTGSQVIEIEVAGVTPKSTVNVNVAPASEVVKSVVITGSNVKDGVAINKLKSADGTTTLVAVGKDVSDGEAHVNPSEVVWTSNNEGLATVTNGVVTVKRPVTKDEEVVITADVFGVKQVITFTISAADSTLKAGTLTLTDADKIDADSKTEGIQIYLDADAEATDAEANGAVKLRFTGKDQYGADFTTPAVNATSYNAAIAKVDIASNVVTVTAVKVGETQIRITLGSEELIYTVKVTQEAVDAATPVVVSSIDTALGLATTAKSGVVISDDGTDVAPGTNWVTQAVSDALDGAISVATAAKGTVENTGEAEAAAAILDTAVGVYTTAKADGTQS